MVHKFVIHQVIEKPFKIGETVICIDDQFGEDADLFYQSLPKKGMRYIVRDCFPLNGTTAVTLSEIKNNKITIPQTNPEYHLSFEPSFSSSRFINSNHEADFIFGIDVN